MSTITIATLDYRRLAKTIDHSLLRPELDLGAVREGVRLAVRYDVASATVRPADVALASELVAGSGVLVSTVIGFPHGSSAAATKVFEAERALADGAKELDMVLNIGWLKSGLDAEVGDEIKALVEVAEANGALVKVILENAYLSDAEKVRGCHLAEEAGARFVKTSTGFAPGGATISRPGADAGHRVARGRYQGCGRRPHARRAARCDERWRHPGRGDRHPGDPRGLQGPQGRVRRLPAG